MTHHIYIFLPGGWKLLAYLTGRGGPASLLTGQGSESDTMQKAFETKDKAPARSGEGRKPAVISPCKAELLILRLLEHSNYSPVKGDRRGFVSV